MSEASSFDHANPAAASETSILIKFRLTLKPSLNILYSPSFVKKHLFYGLYALYE
jgi:hypothetical protein